MKMSSKNVIYAFPVIECVMGNINGDPDNAGEPRVLTDGYGYATAVSYKARMRGYMESVGNKVYLKRGGNINDLFTEYGLKGEKKSKGKKGDDTSAVDAGRAKFCADFIDARLFGATFCQGEPVVGSVQVTDMFSLAEVNVERVTMTTPSREDDKQGTFAKKAFIPYGLYLGNINYFPHVGMKNGVTDSDLDTVFQAAKYAYSYKGSAALGRSGVNKMYLFQMKGFNINLNTLFNMVKPVLKDGIRVPKDINDYVFVDEKYIADVCSQKKIEFEVME